MLPFSWIFQGCSELLSHYGYADGFSEPHGTYIHIQAHTRTHAQTLLFHMYVTRSNPCTALLPFCCQATSKSKHQIFANVRANTCMQTQACFFRPCSDTHSKTWMRVILPLSIWVWNRSISWRIKTQPVTCIFSGSFERNTRTWFPFILAHYLRTKNSPMVGCQTIWLAAHGF